MSTCLSTNIGELVTNDPALGDSAPLGIAQRRRTGRRRRRRSPGSGRAHSTRRRRASTPAARAVIPGFVDSHAHLVFAGDRAAEFAARMAGQPYTGGGIATTRCRDPRPATDAGAAAQGRAAGRRDAPRRSVDSP